MYTSLERKQLVKQDVSGIRAVVHQVQFSDDGDGSVAWNGTGYVKNVYII